MKASGVRMVALGQAALMESIQSVVAQVLRAAVRRVVHGRTTRGASTRKRPRRRCAKLHSASTMCTSGVVAITRPAAKPWAPAFGRRRPVAPR